MIIPDVKRVFQLNQRSFTKGEVGIEIEVEGSNFFRPTKYWAMTHDGSLQGGAEYILSEPLPVDEVKKSLTYFTGALRRHDVNISDSVRTAIHVHINVQDFNLVELGNFITLYLIFEEVLTKYCGDTREGNLFCLRTKDAEGMLVHAIEAFRSQHFTEILNSDDIRYASLNLTSLGKFGSLEFRALKTPSTPRGMSKVNEWVKVLIALRDAAKVYKSPIHIVEMSSAQGPAAYMQEVFGELSEYLLVDGWEERIRSGVVHAQELAYCRDWGELLTPAPVNPFKLSRHG